MHEENGDMDMNLTTHGPDGTGGFDARLARAMEHAQRVAGAQAAAGGVLDPDGAALWLRFCREAGLGRERPS